MLITNQDKDLTMDLSTKDIFYRRHYVWHKGKIMFMGFNLYGKAFWGRELLGTFDTAEACRIVKEEI